MSHHLWYTIRMNNMNNDTYTLWNGNDVVATYPHTREGMDAAMERAHDLVIGGYGKLSIYSNRDDLVWVSTNEEPNEPSDAWHDADALSSAGMGTDEDYGCYGGDCWE